EGTARAVGWAKSVDLETSNLLRDRIYAHRFFLQEAARRSFQRCHLGLQPSIWGSPPLRADFRAPGSLRITEGRLSWERRIVGTSRFGRPGDGPPLSSLQFPNQRRTAYEAVDCPACGRRA